MFCEAMDICGPNLFYFFVIFSLILFTIHYIYVLTGCLLDEERNAQRESELRRGSLILFFHSYL